MDLTDEEKAMLAGDMGEPRRWAIDHQIQVGDVLDAEKFIEVSQAHIMCDTESLGEEGVMVLEYLAGHVEDQRHVAIPTITDPRGADFCHYQKLKQDPSWIDLERRVIDALTSMNVMMTDTCINYQTIAPPVMGEHVAFGDTGVVVYCNSVFGARSNFEGGPSALAAALTGRTPKYGLHLNEHRKGTMLFECKNRPVTMSDWGVLGALVGRACNSYWTVPVITGIALPPTSDEMKHFGAAVASYGSIPMFHMIGITPEARTLEDVFDGPIPDPITINSFDIKAFYFDFESDSDKVDVVVFSAPQLSIIELQKLAGLLHDRKVHKDTDLLVATSPEIKHAADRMGYTEVIETSGGTLMEGVCFYQMHAREMGEANGWNRLLTNSAKLVNIIAGYGYQPALATMEECVEAAVTGVHS